MTSQDYDVKNLDEKASTDDKSDTNLEFVKEFEALDRIKDREARSRAVTLEILGDIPDADAKPPNNVLFVCKLNSVTEAEDLKIIFSRFGAIRSCNVAKDYKTGESLQYAFIEFEEEESCTNAYFKMDNVLIDDRRIHVDFCQSIPSLWNKYKSGRVTRGDYDDSRHRGNPEERNHKYSNRHDNHKRYNHSDSHYDRDRYRHKRRYERRSPTRY